MIEPVVHAEVMKRKILLVEDELHLREALVTALEHYHYDVVATATIAEAKKIFGSFNPEFSVIDIGLPDGTGFELAKYFLSEKQGLKILFVTAHNSPEDRLHGLELGAVDYIGKPFHLKELALRLKNLETSELRTKNEASWCRIGDAEVHFEQYLIRSTLGERTLSQKERDLLHLLLKKSPQVVSREEILKTIWSTPGDEAPSTRTIDNFVVKLRKWIEHDPAHPQTLHSVWGVGYSLRRST